MAKIERQSVHVLTLTDEEMQLVQAGLLLLGERQPNTVGLRDLLDELGGPNLPVGTARGTSTAIPPPTTEAVRVSQGEDDDSRVLSPDEFKAAVAGARAKTKPIDPATLDPSDPRVIEAKKMGTLTQLPTPMADDQ